MPKLVDWDKRLNGIRDLFMNPKPNQKMGSIHKLQSEVIVLNEEYKQFDRLGSLFHSRPRIFVTRTPCKTKVVPNRTTKATVTLLDEQVTKLAKSWSKSVSKDISTGLSATLGGSIGSDLAGKVSASATSQISASKGTQNIENKSIEASIKKALSIQADVELDVVPEDCYTINAPYGLELLVTVRGRVWVSRNLAIELDPQTAKVSKVKWGRTIIKVSVKVDASASVGIDNDNIVSKKIRCDTCPGDAEDGENHNGGSTDGDKGGTKEKPKKKTRRRKPRWIGFHSDRSIEELFGVEPGVLSLLAKLDLKTTGALAVANVPTEKFDLDVETIYALQDQAAWLSSYGQIDGMDASLLVQGLGFDDVDQLDILPMPDELMIEHGMATVGLDEDYDPTAVIDLLAECPIDLD